MPIHDWTRVDAGLFHSFHLGWTVGLCGALNTGGLPANYFALVEKKPRGPLPDELTLMLAPGADPEVDDGTTLLDAAVAPPRTRLVRRTAADSYAGMANRVTVRHQDGDVVAIIDVVSPGNKSSSSELRTFVEKAAALIRHNIHLLVIDLFPPSRRDPQGTHKVLWDEFVDEEFELPPDKPLTLAAYEAGPELVAYVEPVAVGDLLPDMPLFLRPGYHVPVPLEATYQAAWASFPAPLKRLLKGPAPDAPPC